MRDDGYGTAVPEVEDSISNLAMPRPEFMNTLSEKLGMRIRELAAGFLQLCRILAIVSLIPHISFAAFLAIHRATVALALDRFFHDKKQPVCFVTCVAFTIV